MVAHRTSSVCVRMCVRKIRYALDFTIKKEKKQTNKQINKYPSVRVVKQECMLQKKKIRINERMKIK